MHYMIVSFSILHTVQARSFTKYQQNCLGLRLMTLISFSTYMIFRPLSVRIVFFRVWTTSKWRRHFFCGHGDNTFLIEDNRNYNLSLLEIANTKTYHSNTKCNEYYWFEHDDFFKFTLSDSYIASIPTAFYKELLSFYISSQILLFYAQKVLARWKYCLW